MAIYHCSVKIIGRNQGRSAVAAAAYRSGEDLVNQYDGIEHDYRRKNWVEYTKIILPESAPSEYADRCTLWNAVEMAEKSKESQLCREFELALPLEFTKEQQITVVERFAKENLVAQDLIVDIAIHNKPVTDDRNRPLDTTGNVTDDINKMQFTNPHAHVLCTIRPVDSQGKWEKKTEKEYLCKRGDEERGFTAAEFRTAKTEGWEKQYHFVDGKKKIWLSAEEGKARKLDRVNNSPKSTLYGRMNEKIAYMNSRERIYEWRKSWEQIVNEEFIHMQSNIRIDCRSFKDQGREDEIPTIHMGSSATNMDRKAARELREGKPESQVKHSDIGNINKQIKEHNRLVRELKARINAAVKKAKEIAVKIADKLEGLRAKIIGSKYQEKTFSFQMKLLVSSIRVEEDRLDKYGMVAHKVEKANGEAVKEIRQLKDELTDSCSSAAERKIREDRLKELQEQIEMREEFLINIGRMCGFAAIEDYRKAKKDYADKCRDNDKLQKTIYDLQIEIVRLKAEYEAELETIPEGYEFDVKNSRLETREYMESIVKNKLQEKYGEEFEDDRYAQSCIETDRLLDIKTDAAVAKVTEKTSKKYKKRSCPKTF